MPGQHPHDDVLADLAAEVLPEHEARVIEAHVIGCSRCANLLADAERVRQILLADDPGPMPADVWLRIENALSAEQFAAGSHVADPYLGTGGILAAHPYAAPYAADGAGGVGAPNGDGAGASGAEPSAGLRRGARREEIPSYDSGWGHDEWFTQETPAVPGWTPQDEPDLPDAPTAQWSLFAQGEDTAHPQTPHGEHPVDGRRHRTDGSAGTYGAAAAAAWDRASGSGPELDGESPDEEDVDEPDDASSARARAHRWRGTGDDDPAPASDRVKRTRSIRSRRDVMQDVRTGRAGFAGRYTRTLGIAAGVLLVASLGIAVFKALPLGSSSSATTASGGIAASLPEGVAGSGASAAVAAPAAGGAQFGAPANVVLSTGTNYTEGDIVQKALALPQVVIDTTGTLSTAADSAKSATATAPAPAPAPAPASASAAAAGSAPAGSTAALPQANRAVAAPSVPLSGNTSLTQPTALQACLTALGVKDAQPLAVDLARYQGRDAAIIVLAGRDGGYEVWAVERTCKPGSSGSLVYKSVPPQ